MTVFPGDDPDFLTVGLATGATDTGHLYDMIRGTRSRG